MAIDFQSEPSSRLREENGLLVYDADVQLTAAQLDRIRENLRLEREAGFLFSEPLAKSV